MAWIVDGSAVGGGVALLGTHGWGRHCLGARADEASDAGDGHGGRRQERQQARIFWAAVTAQVLLVVSPLVPWSRNELFARTMLVVGEAFVVAPLVVLGAPWRPLGAAFRSILRRTPAEGRGGVRGSTLRRALGHPATGVAAFLCVLYVWHVPGLLDASVSQAPLRVLELISVLGGGIALWLQLIGSHPRHPVWDPLRRTWLIVATLLGTTVLGLALLTSAARWYPAFATGHRALLSATADKAFAGGMVLALPVIPLGALAIWCYAAWLREDEDDDRRLARLLEEDTAPCT